ncbi:MAG: argininosuccinate lyase, partial [Nanoarchaeota archaeon]|nr:argininosuccinate lyase [Nanoarchaeota archaeon]
MKLYQKEPNKIIEKFTVGDDYQLDKKLLKHDCLASIAHANMLKKIGILTDGELKLIIQGLNEIMLLGDKFIINKEHEDCHTAIENYLTEKIGEPGKKIHTARSRNDQVLTALRLYEKDEIAQIKELLNKFKETIIKKIKVTGSLKIPGYTHMQPAMPTDIKTWLGCFLDSSTDNLQQLDALYELIDQSPLGSAAGFGLPITIDKEMTAKELNFKKVMQNPIYCQHSRGKFEAHILSQLSNIMLDINKLASDILFYNTQGYMTLPEDFCTGSSIMPQKKNLDVLELLRAKYHIVIGEEFKIKNLVANLISGYNRDMQLSKKPVINSFDIVKECLEIAILITDNLMILNKDLPKELFATEQVYKLVSKGTPFRED